MTPWRSTTGYFIFLDLQVKRNYIGSVNSKQIKNADTLRRFVLNAGKLILDATKLCFGSLVLGAAIRGEIPAGTLMLIGVIVSIVGAIVGISLVTGAEEK